MINASTKAVTVMVPIKACSISNDSLGLEIAKGPTPWRVPQRAIPDNATAVVIAPRAPNLKAAQSKGKMAMYSSG